MSGAGAFCWALVLASHPAPNASITSAVIIAVRMEGDLITVNKRRERSQLLHELFFGSTNVRRESRHDSEILAFELIRRLQRRHLSVEFLPIRGVRFCVTSPLRNSDQLKQL